MRYLQTILNYHIELSILTDCKSFFKIIVYSTVVIEKRLIKDIKAAGQAYDRREISAIGGIRSNKNLADGLIMLTTSEPLKIVLDTE